MTPDELARLCADVMWTDDVASRSLGMQIESIKSGRCTISMVVRDDMTNGHGIAHGGFIFTLADSAFAFACNSHNVRTVAQACDILFVTAARAGDVLVAEAVERHAYGRNGVYDIRVSREDDVVAEFRGRSRSIGGTHVVVPDADAQTLEAGT